VAASAESSLKIEEIVSSGEMKENDEKAAKVAKC